MRTVLAFLCVLHLASGYALADQTPAVKTLSPHFFIEGQSPGIEAFPLKSTRVTANVTGVIADVTVTQSYANNGTTPINARYVFPGSTRAAVHGMRIRIGDRTVVAKIKERQQAAKEFTEAKAAGKSASLLEQERPNVFTMSVANIMPGDEVEVQLVYSEMLVPTEGLYQFVYPTVVGPRYSKSPDEPATQETTWLHTPYRDEWIKSPYLHQMQRSPSSFSMQVNLSTGVPLATLSCTSHDPKITRDRKSAARVSLENDVGNRDFILNYRLSGNEIESGLLLYEGERENFFLLTVQPPQRVAAEVIPPREYIFVLDVSGSMHGFPLDTAKGVIANLIANLKPTDTFNVLLFSGGSQLWSPTSLPATKENCDKALDTISRESGGGGTELEEALRRAVGLPRSEFVSRSIVVVTDGYIAEEKSAFTLIHDNLQHTNFFAFGIGSGVNRYLVEGIAHAGQGEPFIVTGPGEAAAEGDRFRRYIQSPVLTDIHVKFSGFDAYDVEPNIQPDLFAERPIVMFGKWRGAKKGTVQVTGRPASGVFQESFDVTSTLSRPEHAALSQLWARTRIARLSDFSFQKDDPETIREITNLGLGYNLLTQYTSFIAVLQEVRNTTGLAKNVAQPLPLPQGVSDLAVGESYASGAEPSLILLLTLAAVMVFVLRKRKQSC